MKRLQEIFENDLKEGRFVFIQDSPILGGSFCNSELAIPKSATSYIKKGLDIIAYDAEHIWPYKRFYIIKFYKRKGK